MSLYVNLDKWRILCFRCGRSQHLTNLVVRIRFVDFLGHFRKQNGQIRDRRPGQNNKLLSNLPKKLREGSC